MRSLPDAPRRRVSRGVLAASARVFRAAAGRRIRGRDIGIFFRCQFEPPCFTPACLLRSRSPARSRVRSWTIESSLTNVGCDVPLHVIGRIRRCHVDYQRPLFPEIPDLGLPPHALDRQLSVRSRSPLSTAPIEIAARATHRMVTARRCFAPSRPRPRCWPGGRPAGDRRRPDSPPIGAAPGHAQYDRHDRR